MYTYQTPLRKKKKGKHPTGFSNAAAGAQLRLLSLLGGLRSAALQGSCHCSDHHQEQEVQMNKGDWAEGPVEMDLTMDYTQWISKTVSILGSQKYKAQYYS